MTQKKVCAIVVTYNRKKLLLECIKGLLAQAHPIDKIFIIDNASNDGTETLLREKDWFYNGNVSYENLRANTGGAGGFHAGLKKAYKEGFDWYWLMDDDVEPNVDCLSQLIKWGDVSHCIHPRKYYNADDFFNWECFINPKTGKRISLDDISFREGRSICFTNTMCFEGVLINHDIVSKIGFPDKEYFIVYDDTVYGLYASLHTPVSYVSDALMCKKINKEKVPLTPFFIYYSMRNYFYRQKVVHEIYGSNKWVLNFTTLFVFLGYTWHIIFKLPEKTKGFKALFKGVVHGLCGKKQ